MEYLHAAPSELPRAVLGRSTQAGLQCPACAWAVATPQVSGNHFSPLLYHPQTPPSAAFAGILTVSCLNFYNMFILATAQVKKDRATSQIWWNSGWKMVVDYFPQGNLGEKWGKEQKAESLIFSTAISWGAAQWHNVQDMLCSCLLLSPRAFCSKWELPLPVLKDCWVWEWRSIAFKIFWVISKQFEWSTKQFQLEGLI